jgi:RNA polymerase sigma factor (sigma-70 family)
MERNVHKAGAYEFSITDFQNADERALKFIIMGHWKGLVYFAKNYLSDQQEAEDTVQEVFSTVWNRRYDFPDYDKLRSFLYISVRNRAIDKMEAQRRYTYIVRKASSQAEEPIYEPLSNAEISEMALANTLQRIINLADEHLPPKTKAVFMMAMDGLNDREIAVKMNIARQNVSKYRQRAMNIIREHFLKKGFIPGWIVLWICLGFITV